MSSQSFSKSYLLMPFVICILGSFFYVYDYFLAVAPSVMTHSLMSEFDLSAAVLGTLMAVFSLASTFFQMPAGMMLDKFGARKLLSLSVLISGLGALCFGLAESKWELALARLLMGIGSPFAFLGALYLVSRWFSHRYFAFAAGLIQLGAALGSIIGGGPLAVLVDHMGWRTSWIWIGWATLILSLLFWLVLRDGDGTVKGSALAQETQAKLLDTLKIPQVWWIALVGFCSWVTITGLGSLWGVPYLMAVYHWDNADIGYLYILFWLGLGLGSPFIGWMSDKMQSRKIPFCICFGIGFIASIFYIEAPLLPKYLMVFVLFFLGFVASAQSLTFGIVKDIVPAKHFVAASGLINLAAVFTGVIMQPVMGYLMDLHAKSHIENYTGHYLIKDYQVGLIPVAIVLLLGFLISFFALKETHCRVQKG